MIFDVNLVAEEIINFKSDVFTESKCNVTAARKIYCYTLAVCSYA